MSLILTALRQIEAREPPSSCKAEPITAEERADLGLDRNPAAWTRTAAVMEMSVAETEALLDRVESAEPVLEPEHDGPSPEPLVVHSDTSKDVFRAPPPHRANPQYDDLADKLLSRCRADRSQAFLVTSPSRYEGKTEVAVPLAVVLANRLPKDVLLVDANLYHPDVAACLDLYPEVGLGDVLSGQGMWREAICRAPAAHLDVLPGVGFNGDLDLQGGLRIASLLDEIRRHYRLILLDAPSLEQPLAATMARACDGVYLVVHLGQTTRRALRQAIETLDRCDGHLLGGIVVTP